MKLVATMAQLGQLISFLKSQYGIEIVPVGQEPESDWVAELRDRRMRVNLASRGAEGAIFIVAHVFGHMVQFATTKRYNAMLEHVHRDKPPIEFDAQLEREYRAYEFEAYMIGRGLLSQVMEVSDEMDRRYQVFMATDLEYYWRYLVTGHGGSQRDFDRIFAMKMTSEYPGLRSPMPSLEPPKSLKLKSDLEINVV